MRVLIAEDSAVYRTLLTRRQNDYEAANGADAFEILSGPRPAHGGNRVEDSQGISLRKPSPRSTWE